MLPKQSQFTETDMYAFVYVSGGEVKFETGCASLMVSEQA